MNSEVLFFKCLPVPSNVKKPSEVRKIGSYRRQLVFDGNKLISICAHVTFSRLITYKTLSMITF